MPPCSETHAPARVPGPPFDHARLVDKSICKHASLVNAFTVIQKGLPSRQFRVSTERVWRAGDRTTLTQSLSSSPINTRFQNVNFYSDELWRYPTLSDLASRSNLPSYGFPRFFSYLSFSLFSEFLFTNVEWSFCSISSFNRELCEVHTYGLSILPCEKSFEGK